MTGYNEKVNVGILDYVWIEVWVCHCNAKPEYLHAQQWR